LGAFERGESFGAQETMGIGDDAEEERFHLRAQTSTAAYVLAVTRELRCAANG
jgi:hypothetical protein